jgi:hypothetical protein
MKRSTLLCVRIKEIDDDAMGYAARQYSENPVTSGFSTVEEPLDPLASCYRK